MSTKELLPIEDFDTELPPETMRDIFEETFPDLNSARFDVLSCKKVYEGCRPRYSLEYDLYSNGEYLGRHTCHAILNSNKENTLVCILDTSGP